MAVEAKRGCGYRKVGGIYLVGGDMAHECDRLPFPLEVCPCCGAGIKFTRGWTWIKPERLFRGNHGRTTMVEGKPAITVGCRCPVQCPSCFPSIVFNDPEANDTGRAGLLWIGKQFYATPADFVREGMQQGISRRISAIPLGFELGKTWVFFAHIEAANSTAKKIPVDDTAQGESGQIEMFDDVPAPCPGIFAAFRPSRIERIVRHSEFAFYEAAVDRFKSEFSDDVDKRDLDFFAYLEANGMPADDIKIIRRLQSDVDRGITLVWVPDGDPDHDPNMATREAE